MRIAPLFLLAALVSTRADEPQLRPIFSGTDLAGWKVPDGNAEKGWYKAAGGILKLQSDPTLKGSILWTEKSYRDFVMSFDFKFGAGIVDSGIHIRNNDQIQIGISGSLKRDMTGSPYVGKYPVEAKGVAALLKADDWNSMKIEARGLRYQVWLNGQQVLDYTSQSGIPEGPVGIQLHGNKEMAIDYREIKLAELP